MTAGGVDSDGYSSFSEYWFEKYRKINNQLKDAVVHRSELFSGLTFYINGRCKLLTSEINKLIVENGGFITYSSDPNVSHIVTENIALGTKKWKSLLKRKKM